MGKSDNDLLRDVGDRKALSRILRQMRRQIDALSRSGPIARTLIPNTIPFTGPDQIAVSNLVGKPAVLRVAEQSLPLRADEHLTTVEVAEGQIIGRPSGGNFGATTPSAMGALLKDFSNPTKRTEVGNYTAALTDFIIMMDLTAGSKTLTLPLNPGTAYDGKLYIVGDPDDTWAPTSSVLTVARGGVGDTINGSTNNVTIQSIGACLLLHWNQTPRNWNAWVWTAVS